MEAASVDECFADFTETLKNEKDPVQFFRKMQSDLFKETGLKCSIGVSTTRFLAKMASDYQKPMGLTIIHKRDIDKILFPLEMTTKDKVRSVAYESHLMNSEKKDSFDVCFINDSFRDSSSSS